MGGATIATCHVHPGYIPAVPQGDILPLTQGIFCLLRNMDVRRVACSAAFPSLACPESATSLSTPFSCSVTCPSPCKPRAFKTSFFRSPPASPAFPALSLQASRVPSPFSHTAPPDMSPFPCPFLIHLFRSL